MRAARPSARACSKSSSILLIPRCPSSMAAGPSSRPNHSAAVCDVLVAAAGQVDQDRPASGPSSVRRATQRAGQGMRGLDRGDDALGAAQQLERRHRLVVRDRLVAGRARCRPGRSAPGRRPGSRGRPRWSATRWSGRRRPAAGRSGRRAARRACRPVMVAACRPVVDAVAAGLDADSRTESSSRKPWNRPMALLPPPTQATTSSGSAPSRSRICARASSPMTAWKSRTMAGKGCGPAAVPIR